MGWDRKGWDGWNGMDGIGWDGMGWIFNIFINDMFYLDLESAICNFADDTTIYACDKSIDTVIVKLEDDLQKILNWFIEN